MTVEEIIEEEYRKLSASSSVSEQSNMLYNIIKLKVKIHQFGSIYKDIKKFIDAYIESIKLADYGYDNFNYSKIEQLINYLPFSQRISILQYITSVSSRELPEYDRTWFITTKHKSEIEQIIEKREYVLYPKAILLYLGQSMKRLLFGLTLLFLFTCLILLPAPIELFANIEVTYEDYSQSFALNHFINILTLYADLNNNVKVEPVNPAGLLVIIFGKLLFVTFIVNFFYFRISDKIAQK